jgi:hypothetical protein
MVKCKILVILLVQYLIFSYFDKGVESNAIGWICNDKKWKRSALPLSLLFFLILYKGAVLWQNCLLADWICRTDRCVGVARIRFY